MSRSRIARVVPVCLNLSVIPAFIIGVASCMSHPHTAGHEAPRDADLAAEHRAWHAQRLATLQAEDGWLTLVGLDFLPEGVSTIGSAADATFRYANCAEPIVGRIERAGGRVRFTPTTGGGTVDCTADDAGAPTVLRSGSVSFTLVRRNGLLALRVRDNASPVRTGFAGIALFPHDPALRVEARVEVPPPGATVAITNVTGFVEEQPVAAVLRFRMPEAGAGGAATERRLVATAGSGGRLFVVFGDETNGVETYGGGRFLDIAAPVDGVAWIDFNRATNPPCSFTPYATCPLPPEDNRLPVRVPAGEKFGKSSESAAAH